MTLKTQPLPPATTQTTRLLLPWAVTRTARLRAALRRVDPYELVIVGALLLVVLVATLQANLPLLASAWSPPAPTVQQPIIAFRDRVVERQVYLVATPTAAPAAPAEAIVDNAPAEQPAAAQPAPAEPTPAPAAPAELQVMHAPVAAQQAAPAAAATKSPYDYLPTAVIAVTPPAPGARVVVDPNMPLRIATATPRQ